MNNPSYAMTGFQSPCAEFAEKPLSLDERYLANRAATFIIEVTGTSKTLGIRTGDKLIIDRSVQPKQGQLVLLVISNQFQVQLFSTQMPNSQDSETEDFVWGVVTTLLREFR